ncbi:MAG: hypothetical protein ACO3TG_00845 [Minisyncoccia bacterium]
MTILILKGNQEHEDSYLNHELVECVHAIEKVCLTFNKFVWRFSVSTNLDRIIITSHNFDHNQEKESEILTIMQNRRNKLIQIALLNRIPKEEIVEI